MFEIEKSYRLKIGIHFIGKSEKIEKAERCFDYSAFLTLFSF